jgi:hypothetical protein
MRLLLEFLGLAPTHEGLIWTMTDERGPALTLRSWRSRYSTSDHELPRPSLRDSALFLRFDLFERLEKAMDQSVV